MSVVLVGSRYVESVHSTVKVGLFCDLRAVFCCQKMVPDMSLVALLLSSGVEDGLVIL